MRGARTLRSRPCFRALIRTRRTRNENATISVPVAISVPLNMYPENTWNVPNWLKCSCHQFGSGVVRIDVSDPRTVSDISIPTAWIVSLRDAACVAISDTTAMLMPDATVACSAVTWASPLRPFRMMNVSATKSPEMRA